MKLKQYQKIRLKDGRAGHITEIFKDGEAYLVDIPTDDGEYEQATVSIVDIKSIMVEIEEPFAST